MYDIYLPTYLVVFNGTKYGINVGKLYNRPMDGMGHGVRTLTLFFYHLITGGSPHLVVAPCGTSTGVMNVALRPSAKKRQELLSKNLYPLLATGAENLCFITKSALCLEWSTF